MQVLPSKPIMLYGLNTHIAVNVDSLYGLE